VVSFIEWVGLAEDRDRWRALVNAVTNIPSNAQNFLTNSAFVGFSRKPLLHGDSLVGSKECQGALKTRINLLPAPYRKSKDSSIAQAVSQSL
jgi:hypothetical protein